MTADESSTDLREAMTARFSGATEDVPLSPVTRLQHASDIAARSGYRRVTRWLPGSPSAEADQRAAERVVLSLGRLKGVPMKLGQLAGYMDSSVPAPLRPAFAALENQAQALGISRVRAMLAKELGPRAADLRQSIQPRPIAVASIGQVHRAELEGVPVAVKVQYPGIERTIKIDFRPAAFGARAINAFRRRGRRGDSLISEVMARVLEECAYGREAERQMAFAQFYEEHPVIEVPEVHAEHSTDTVLTTRFIEGLHLDDYLATNPSAEDRRRAGIALVDFYVGSLFLMGAYNSDPHPGNYLFQPDGRVAVLDHGAGRTFGLEAVEGIRALARATLTDDRRAMREALYALGAVPAGRRIHDRPMHQVLAWLFGPLRQAEASVFTLPTAQEVRQITRAVRDFDALDQPTELVFLVRLRVALSAVLARLEARATWRDVLEAHLDGRFYLRPPTYEVVLVDPGEREIELLRALRDELGSAVTEAKALIDDAPSVVGAGLDRKAAQAFGDRLGAAGAKV